MLNKKQTLIIRFFTHHPQTSLYGVVQPLVVFANDFAKMANNIVMNANSKQFLCLKYFYWSPTGKVVFT